MELSRCLLQLTEVEYLVDQTEEILGVAVHDAQCMLQVCILHRVQEVFHRRDDEREWRAQVVTDIGELQLHVVHLFLAPGSKFYLAHLLSELLTAAIVTIAKVTDTTQDEDIEQITPCRIPKRGSHLYAQKFCLLILMMVDILLLDQQPVLARRQVGQGDDIVVHRQPFLAESLQLIIIGNQIIGSQSLRMALYHDVVLVML